MPVVETFLFGEEHRLARVAVLVEVFREAAFGAREADEVIDFAGFRFDEEIMLSGDSLPERPRNRGDSLSGAGKTWIYWNTSVGS